MGDFVVPVGVPLLSDIVLRADSPDPKSILRRRQALSALINLGDNIKGFHKLPASEQEAILALLDKEAGSANPRRVAAMVQIAVAAFGTHIHPAADRSRRTHPDHDVRDAAEPQALVQRLEREPLVSARRALVLCLGEFPEDRWPANMQQPLVVKLLQAYRDDPDPGLHSALDWLLRRWGQAERVKTRWGQAHRTSSRKPLTPYSEGEYDPLAGNLL